MKRGDWIKLPATTSTWHAAISADRTACGSWVTAASIVATQARQPPAKFCCPKCVEAVERWAWLRYIGQILRRARR